MKNSVDYRSGCEFDYVKAKKIASKHSYIHIDMNERKRKETKAGRENDTNINTTAKHISLSISISASITMSQREEIRTPNFTFAYTLNVLYIIHTPANA